LGHWWDILACNGLLLLFLLLGGPLTDGLAGRRFQDKLKNLERVGILWGGSRDTKGVSGWKRDLLTLSTICDLVCLVMMGAYLVGREADLVVDGNFEERVGVLELHH
jgi:hypothetical protein